jgi:hypothetical protein
MDEIVLRAMARWPNVPAVYGWLALDRRGRWLLRGSPVAHPAINEFIGRNYARDERGRWFFQNGPQRVFVSLEYTPFVYRVPVAAGAPPALRTHTGRPAASLRGAWLDENGSLLVETEHGIGLVHDSDLELVLGCFADASGAPLDERGLEEALARIQSGRAAPLRLALAGASVEVEPIRSAHVPERFAFVREPAPPADEPRS